jgi:hypothetical protein
MKRSKRFLKDISGYTAGAVGLGIGSSVLGEIGGTTSGYGQQGLSNASKFLPATGTMIGAGMMFGALNELARSATYKKRKRKY